MTAREISAKYAVSLATAKRYKKANAPVDDEPAMREWMESHRSRMLVGKRLPRHTNEPMVPTVREITAQVIPAAPIAPAEAPEADDSSTLQRLEQAERVAYQRYFDTGGSERAAQVWRFSCATKSENYFLTKPSTQTTCLNRQLGLWRCAPK
jgi:hypothetical protein